MPALRKRLLQLERYENSRGASGNDVPMAGIGVYRARWRFELELGLLESWRAVLEC